VFIYLYVRSASSTIRSRYYWAFHIVVWGVPAFGVSLGLSLHHFDNAIGYLPFCFLVHFTFTHIYTHTLCTPHTKHHIPHPPHTHTHTHTHTTFTYIRHTHHHTHIPHTTTTPPQHRTPHRSLHIHPHTLRTPHTITYHTHTPIINQIPI